MKKLVLYMAMLLVGISYAFAQGKADIKFDKTSYDFGTFSENSPVVSCVFSGHTSGYCFLRMYGARIHTGTGTSWQNGYDKDNL